MTTNEQIAREAVDHFCGWHTHVINKESQDDLLKAFLAAIEQAVEAKDMEIATYAMDKLKNNRCRR